jgi:Zn finger protein HypA/HybF involved in hydrogenase expression
VHLRATTNKSIVPDAHDPDFYCRSCEQTYENQRVYRLHLRLQHEMNIKLVAHRRRIRIATRKRLSEQEANSSNPEIDSTNSITNSSDPGIASADAPLSQVPERSTNTKSTEPDQARPKQARKPEIYKRTRSKHEIETEKPVQPWQDTTKVVINSPGILSQPASRRSIKETAIVNPFAKIDINHPKNYCVKCDVYFITKLHFGLHIKSRHNIKPPSSSPPPPPPPPPPPKRLASPENPNLDDLPCRKRAKVITDSDIEIDMSHPEYYCGKCSKKSSSEAAFRNHMKGVHGLITEIRPYRCNIYPDAEIDVNHPELYCAKCDKNLSKRAAFIHHLRIIHGLLDEGLQAPFNIYPDAEIDARHPEFYCAKCDRKSSTKANFWFHLKNVHDMDYPQESSKGNILFPDAEINVNHPEFYCAQCHLKFLSKVTFRTHLRRTHSVKVKHSSVIYPNAVVDINDPNFHCTKCDKYLKNNKSFRSHLSKKHRMIGLRRERAKPSKMIIYPDAEIDPNHPECHCPQCDRSFLHKSSFDDHLRKIHDFDIKTPKERAVPYPDAEIDLNHPESYCAKCDRYLKPSSFRKHLAHFHQVIPKDQKGFIRSLRNGRMFETCYY